MKKYLLHYFISNYNKKLHFVPLYMTASHQNSNLKSWETAKQYDLGVLKWVTIWIYEIFTTPSNVFFSTFLFLCLLSWWFLSCSLSFPLCLFLHGFLLIDPLSAVLPISLYQYMNNLTAPSVLTPTSHQCKHTCTHRELIKVSMSLSLLACSLMLSLFVCSSSTSSLFLMSVGYFFKFNLQN